MSTQLTQDLLALDSAAQDLLFRAARTANTFTDEPVTDAQLRAVHDLVRFAPTAFNAQPLRVVLVRSAEARQRLLPHVAEGNQAKTASAPLVAILAADMEFHEHLPRLVPDHPGLRELFVGPERAAGREAQARFNATLQIGYFIIGVRAAGLAAGPMAGFDRDGLDAEFFPDGQMKSLLLVNIGRPGPDAWQDRRPRLDADEVIQVL